MKPSVQGCLLASAVFLCGVGSPVADAQSVVKKDVTFQIVVDDFSGMNGVVWCRNPDTLGAKLYRKVEPVRVNPGCTTGHSDQCAWPRPTVTSDQPDHICYTASCRNNLGDNCATGWDITLVQVSPTPDGEAAQLHTTTKYVDNANNANLRICSDPFPGARVLYRDLQWTKTRNGTEFRYWTSPVFADGGQICVIAHCSAKHPGDACGGTLSLNVDVYP